MKSTVLGLAAALFAFPVAAQDAPRGFVGLSRLFNNDVIGDGKDRWRTGSYQASLTWGHFEDRLPDRPFALMEYRLRAEIIAPEDLSRATAFPDRPYAGVIGLGAFTHFTRAETEISLGGELAFVGPSTGLGRFQTWAHERLSVQTPAMLSEQLPDRVYPTLHAAVARRLSVGEAVVRPFGELQAGLETFARVGVDVLIGASYRNNFFIREPVTGHLMTNVRDSDDRSWGFVMGGDLAGVAHSNLLPGGRGYDVRSTRVRARAGVAYQGENSGVFYGLTYLGPEFEGQSEGQMTGSLHLRFNF